MSYRTYLYCEDDKNPIEDYNCIQILGNNEYYQEWFDEMIKQKMITKKELNDDEFCYNKLEIKDIMGFVIALEQVALNMEKQRIIHKSEHTARHNSLSLFDFSDRFTKIIESESSNDYSTYNLTDELFEITEYSYIFMPYALLNFCILNDCLEEVPIKERPEKYKYRLNYYRIKKGKRIFIEAD